MRGLSWSISRILFSAIIYLDVLLPKHSCCLPRLCASNAI